MSQTIETPAVVTPPAPAPAVPVPGTPEYSARMAALAPANVPDKFKNQDGTINVAALTEAYRNSEKKVTELGQAAAAAPAAPAPKADEVVDLNAAFAKPTTGSSDVWAAAQSELAAEGKISPATREALMKSHGATDSMIVSIEQGHQAQRAEVGRKLADAVGGVQNLNDSIAFAKSKMNETQLTALRAALESPMGPLVLKGIHAEMQAARPATAPAAKAEPKSLLDTVNAGSGANDAQPFSSHAEMVAWFKDPRYIRDPAFREKAGRRMLATQNRPR